MARRGGGLFSGLKDSTQRNRNMILYVLLLVSLFGALGGWLSLPDRVTMMGTTEGVEPIYLPKLAAIGINLGVSGGFSLLFWWRPRELAYLTCALIGIFMTYFIMPANLGYFA